MDDERRVVERPAEARGEPVAIALAERALRQDEMGLFRGMRGIG